MTIGEFCGNFGNFEENWPLQAVEFCIFTLFSRLQGMAKSFDTGIIYILNENRVFALVLYLKTRHFQNTENKANAHVCDRRMPAASFCYMVYCLIAVCLYASGLWGRELFVLIVFGQSRPPDDRCIQLHAFFISRKSLELSARTRVNARWVSLLFFDWKLDTFKHKE